MGAEAQVHEAAGVAASGAVAVAAHGAALRRFRGQIAVGPRSQRYRLDDGPLVGMLREELQGLLRGHLDPLEGLVGRDDLPHPGLDALQVGVGEGAPVG